MNIQVRGDNLGVTNALSDYVDRKIGRLQKYFDAPPEREVTVRMSVEHGHHQVEVMMQMHGMLFRAEEGSEDMYASIDLVTDKLEQQINRHKEKLNKRFRERGVRTRIKADVMHEQAMLANTSEPRVVRMKRHTMKPMDVEEAMLQLDLLGHDFFMFTNAESNEVNVLYRRRDGQFGLIEPN